MPVITDDQWRLKSKSDHYALQKMADHVVDAVIKERGNNRDPIRAIVGGGTHVIDQAIRIEANGDTWAPFEIDFGPALIEGKNNASHNILEIDNISGGNLRDWRIVGGNFRFGRAGIMARKVHYGRFLHNECTQNWLAGVDLKTNGRVMSNMIVNLGIQEPRMHSAIIEGGWAMNGLRVSENCGCIIVKWGQLTVDHFMGCGFNLVNGPDTWGNAGYTEGDPWAEAGVPVPANLFEATDTETANQVLPIFYLSSSGLRLRGEFKSNFDSIENPTGHLYAAPNTMIYARRAYDIDVEVKMRADPDIKAIIAEEFLAENKDNYWTDVRLRGLDAMGDIYLHKRTIRAAPDHPTIGYPTVRSRRKFCGYVRMHNGGQILQDNHAPVDMTNVDMVAA
jgi:hypothetical protein